MRFTSEREEGLYRMAHELGWSNRHTFHVVGHGCSTGHREDGPLVIDVEYDVKTKVEGRWLLRIWIKITYEGRVVFHAWEARLVGETEPNGALVIDFQPGPWETRLADLWKKDKSPS